MQVGLSFSQKAQTARLQILRAGRAQPQRHLPTHRRYAGNQTAGVRTAQTLGMGGRASRPVQGEPAIPQSATGTAGGQHHHQRGEEHPHYRSCRHCRDTRQHDARYDAGGAVHHRATQQPCGTTHPVYLLMAGRKHQP